MPIDPNAVGKTSEPVEVSWTSKDALLYALGVGAGQGDPTGFELEFTTENSQNIAQAVLPTMPVGKSDEHLAYPGTLSLSAPTIIKLWTEIGECVHRAELFRDFAEQ